MTTLFTIFLSFGTLLSSIFTITSKNPVISVIFLITTFVQAAIYLILNGISFIGISYIVIYVGAIAVLFLFVIMMINIKLTDILETGSQYTKNLPLAISIAILFLFIFISQIPLYFYSNSILPYLFNQFNFINDIILLKNSILNDYNFDSLILTLNNYRPLINISNVSNNNNLLYDLSLSKFVSNSDIKITTFQQIEVLGHSLYTNGGVLLIILSIILLLSMLAIIVISKNNKNI